MLATANKILLSRRLIVFVKQTITEFFSECVNTFINKRSEKLHQSFNVMVPCNASLFRKGKSKKDVKKTFR